VFVCLFVCLCATTTCLLKKKKLISGVNYVHNLPPAPFFCFFDDDEKELAQGFRTVRKEKKTIKIIIIIMSVLFDFF
jgi:hypothetical protein